MGHIANLRNSLYQKAHLLKAIIKLLKTKNIISFLRRPELVAVLKIGSSAPWFFKTFCICNTYGIQSILCEKNIPHRDCGEMGAISKYLSNIAFFCIIYMYIGKNSTFRTTCKFQFLKKHKLEKFWKIVKWYLYEYGYCLYLSRKKNEGSPLKYSREVIWNSENISNERKFDLKCTENKSKMLCSLNQS